MTPYFGEFLSLLTALLWGVAVVLFKKSGETVHPVALNLFKSSLAFVLFIPTMAILGISFFGERDGSVWGVMLLSGLLGIGVGDTLFFHSLRCIGASRMAVLTCLYSPIVIGFSHWKLRETLSPYQWLGVVMIVGAVYLVSMRDRSASGAPLSLLLKGVLLGIASFITMAIGMVLMKPYLTQESILWVNQVRLFAGIAFLFIYLIVYPGARKSLNSLLIPQGKIYTFWGSFIGAYLALVPWVGSLKYTSLSVASTLGQTSNLFTFILAIWLLKEPLNLGKILGMLLGTAGAILVVVGGSN